MAVMIERRFISILLHGRWCFLLGANITGVDDSDLLVFGKLGHPNL